MEIREDQVMDQLFRVRVHAAAALQHPAHGGVLQRAGDQAAGPRQETLGQVQGVGGGADAAPGHHEVYRQEVSQCRSGVSGAITGCADMKMVLTWGNNYLCQRLQFI